VLWLRSLGPKELFLHRWQIVGFVIRDRIPGFRNWAHFLRALFPEKAQAHQLSVSGIFNSTRALALWVSIFMWVLRPGPLLACAACYGQSDSPMAKGMNWGIFSLLAVVIAVLGGIATFFVFLARRSATHSASAAQFSITTH
jgi:hypothetical protein